MSNIYIQEPPTEGKILLVTSVGDFDIELWSKECPKACRNFVQLCLEEYYNNTIFHRVIQGFIAQGGDPTGTGEGGESIYGKPFKDEVHSRLRFVRRGLVAMANAGANSNSSQFFFTLGQCQELQNKHTIFGKVAGDTVYNLPQFDRLEVGKDDRPVYPPKIIRTEVLKNPFPDIVPRVVITNEVPESELGEPKKKGTKNFQLLSFGDEAEEEEEEIAVATRSFASGSSAHDIANDPTLSSSTQNATESADQIENIRKRLRRNPPGDDEEVSDGPPITSDVEAQLEKDKKILDLKAEIKKLKEELSGFKKQKQKDVKEEKEDTEDSEALKLYYDDIKKYKNEKNKMLKKGSSREVETLSMMNRFKKKVEDISNDASDTLTVDEEDENDDNWIRHRLTFGEERVVLAKDASIKDSDWYDINDPRNTLVKRRREDKNK